MTLSLFSAWHDIILYGLTSSALVASTSSLLIKFSTLSATTESGARGKYVLNALRASPFLPIAS